MPFLFCITRSATRGQGILSLFLHRFLPTHATDLFTLARIKRPRAYSHVQTFVFTLRDRYTISRNRNENEEKKKKNRTSTCTDRCFIPSLPQPLSVSFFFRGSRQVRTTRSVETVDALPSFVLCAVASICNVRARVKSRFAELGFIGEWSSRLLTALVSKDFECSTLDTAGDFLSHK